MSIHDDKYVPKKWSCSHPSCDAVEHEDDEACPWHSGNCLYCDYSDCRKSHPKCDGLTYDERNKFQ